MLRLELQRVKSGDSWEKKSYSIQLRHPNIVHAPSFAGVEIFSNTSNLSLFRLSGELSTFTTFSPNGGGTVWSAEKNVCFKLYKLHKLQLHFSITILRAVNLCGNYEMRSSCFAFRARHPAVLRFFASNLPIYYPVGSHRLQPYFTFHAWEIKPLSNCVCRPCVTCWKILMLVLSLFS